MKRKAKQIKEREINLCKDCELYIACPLRMRNKPMKDYVCHSGIKWKRLAISQYERMIKKTVRLRGGTNSEARTIVKKWISKDVLNNKYHKFSVYRLSVHEAKKLIVATNRYLS